VRPSTILLIALLTPLTAAATSVNAVVELTNIQVTGSASMLAYSSAEGGYRVDDDYISEWHEPMIRPSLEFSIGQSSGVMNLDEGRLISNVQWNHDAPSIGLSYVWLAMKKDPDARIVLAPGETFAISADARIELDADTRAPQSSNLNGHAYLALGASFYEIPHHGRPTFTSYDGIDLWSHSFASESRHLTVSLFNHTSADWYVYMADVSIGAFGGVSPVPEPTAMWLMPAGLLAVMWRRRNRLVSTAGTGQMRA
jgi:hypothetical protein